METCSIIHPATVLVPPSDYFKVK